MFAEWGTRQTRAAHLLLKRQFRLSSEVRFPASGTNAKTHKIASNKKYKFQFLAKDVPNVRSVFIIHGQRYICEKITATFTEDGMSELMKGEFWLVED